jgi:hypothetical protein
LIKNKKIRANVEAARLRSTDPKKGKEPRPILMSSPGIRTAIQEIDDGHTLTIPDVCEKLRCKKDKALRLVRKRDGVVKIGKSYLIPRSVFEAIIRESLVA